jgi:hypothetical protein
MCHNISKVNDQCIELGRVAVYYQDVAQYVGLHANRRFIFSDTYLSCSYRRRLLRQGDLHANNTG